MKNQQLFFSTLPKSVLKEYIENLKEQIEFLRFIAQQNDTIKNLSDGMKQRNFIEAKEKGIDQI